MDQFITWCKHNLTKGSELVNIDLKNIEFLITELKINNVVDYAQICYFTKDNCIQKFHLENDNTIILNIGEKELFNIYSGLKTEYGVMFKKNSIIRINKNDSIEVVKNTKNKNNNYKNFFCRPKNYYRIFLIIYLNMEKIKQCDKKIDPVNDPVINENEDTDIESIYEFLDNYY